MKRQKGYSFINITGLAVGLSCCILILIYVRAELSYDRYHNDAERIYRVSMIISSQTATTYFAPIAFPVAPVLKENFPQVEFAVRIYKWGSWIIKRGDNIFNEHRVMYAGQDLFNIITIPFLQGDPATALERPGTIVISKRMAEKYFGSEDPYKRTLIVNNNEYEITGIVKDCPVNTHLKYDFIISLKTIVSDFNKV